MSSLVGILKGRGATGFGYSSTAQEVTADLDLHGQTYLVTGCNSGLGLETVKALTGRGAKVLGTARTLEKAQTIAGQFALGMVVPFACELAEPNSVRLCADEVIKQGFFLDAIICNAGIMALPKLTTQFDIELQFLTNHIGHFILVTSLLDRLLDQSRVVVVSSTAHRYAPKGGIDFENLSGLKGYSPYKAYGQSKLANILFVKELAKRLAGSGKTANSLHPGVIRTNLMRHMNKALDFGFKTVVPLFFKNAAEGAATQCFLAAHPKAAGISGEYWADCNLSQPSAYGRDATLAARLWHETEKLVERL